MYAISFDLVVADTEQHHPKGVAQAYSDIAITLGKFGFTRIQGSLYTRKYGEFIPSDECVKSNGLVPTFSS